MILPMLRKHSMKPVQKKKNGIVHRNLYPYLEVTELVILEISSNITLLEISGQQHHIPT